MSVALLIDTEHQRVFRRVHVKTDHIGQLLHEARVAGELQLANQMRLEAVLRQTRFTVSCLMPTALAMLAQLQ
jgi:hypothetical protein